MATLQEVLDASARYQISAVTGAVGAGASTKTIFYAQNTSATKQMLIERVRINGHVATTAYAVGQVTYKLFVARGFTAENVTPTGTALTITGVNQRLRTSSPSTAFAVIRVGDTTSTGIAAPTWTLDSNPVSQLISHSSAGCEVATPIIGNQYLPNNGELFNIFGGSEFPIVLGVNEGVALQVTVPATGVAVHGITMKWAETDRVNF